MSNSVLAQLHAALGQRATYMYILRPHRGMPAPLRQAKNGHGGLQTLACVILGIDVYRGYCSYCNSSVRTYQVVNSWRTARSSGCRRTSAATQHSTRYNQALRCLVAHEPTNHSEASAPQDSPALTTTTSVQLLLSPANVAWQCAQWNLSVCICLFLCPSCTLWIHDLLGLQTSFLTSRHTFTISGRQVLE